MEIGKIVEIGERVIEIPGVAAPQRVEPQPERAPAKEPEKQDA